MNCMRLNRGDLLVNRNDERVDTAACVRIRIIIGRTCVCLGLVSWCFEPSQPQRGISGLCVFRRNRTDILCLGSSDLEVQVNRDLRVTELRIRCACVGGEISVNRTDMCLYIIVGSCCKYHFCRDKL